MSRQRKEEYENTYVDDRIKSLLPQFEALAPYKITQRKKGVGDLTGWHKLAIQEARRLKVFQEFSARPSCCYNLKY
jgi:hypothetical protein